jgi:FkbM family methyltransferase
MWLYHAPQLLLDLAAAPVFVAPTQELAGQHWQLRIAERPLIEWAQQFLQPGQQLVDAGANLGTWTVLFARAGHPVTAFEAQPACHEYLDLNVRLNQVKSLVSTFPTTLGSPGQAAAGKITAYSLCPQGGGVSVHPEWLTQLPNNPPGDPAISHLPVRTLDEFRLRDVGLLKLDVEGNELEVLQGARTTLAHNHWPFIIFEAWPFPWYAPRRQLLLEYLHADGYHVQPIAGCPDMYLADHPG